MKKRVFVAMSGGVDSSVAAALLKKKGYDVYGVFIKGWHPPSIWKINCTWREDRRDAMRVAAVLNIPFYTFDFEKEYKKFVIDYMTKEYQAGKTPNPDVMCNKRIKFDMFLKKALRMGADKIATGHYVQLVSVGYPVSHRLKIAKDLNKDQSYFLWTLKQEQLKHCLFPVGNYLKSEVRVLAKKFKLPVAEKRESQGLCFVGEFKLEDFLKNYIKPRPGKIIDEKGKVIGEHRGVQYYTIGQRQGLNLSAGIPYYIVAKDVKKNILMVASGKTEKDFYKKEVKIKNVNWVVGEAPALKKKYLARIRYRQELQKCKIFYSIKNLRSDKIYRIEFDESQRAVAFGQSLAIYKGSELLGGGIIA